MRQIFRVYSSLDGRKEEGTAVECLGVPPRISRSRKDGNIQAKSVAQDTPPRELVEYHKHVTIPKRKGTLANQLFARLQRILVLRIAFPMAPHSQSLIFYLGTAKSEGDRQMYVSRFGSKSMPVSQSTISRLRLPSGDPPVYAPSVHFSTSPHCKVNMLMKRKAQRMKNELTASSYRAM